MADDRLLPPEPIEQVADLISNALARASIDYDTVNDPNEVEFFIAHGGRKIHFIMRYDEEGS